MNHIEFNYKNKFNTNDDPSKYSPGYYKIDKDKMNSISIENKLQFNKYKDNKTLDRIDFYYTNSAVGPGHGFGNLEISNEIRNGNSSRIDSREFKEIRESSQLFDYQFQYLDRDFQNPDHIVMPIPRGGNTTREKTQLFINHNIDNINFNY
jgi:hypothetical protein